MKVEKDYEEFLRLLNKNRVKYCVIGSFALAIHAKPRYTKDIDILIEPEEKNSSAILRTLQQFGFSSIEITEKDFLKLDQIIQLGYEPVLIDLLTSIAGCSFAEVWRNKVTVRYGKVDAFFMGKEELIKNKRAAGRKQDLADLELLCEKD
jgi:hypothetical protein